MRIDPSWASACSGGRVALIVQAEQREALQGARDLLLGDRPGNRVTTELPIIDGFAAELDVETLQRLPELEKRGLHFAPDALVRLPEPEPPGPRPELDTARRTLNVQPVWDQGLKGRGVGIAIIDTGLAPHPDLAGRIIAFHDLVNERTEPYDDQGHGTHVAGIAAGSGARSGGAYAGVAPEADLIGVKVLDKDGEGRMSRIVNGIQWALDNKARYHIRAANLSLGAKSWLPPSWDPMARAVERAVAGGLVVAVAAGNSGPKEGSIETPGVAPNAITVGNLDEQGTPQRADDRMASSSSRGSEGGSKPDVCAPGTWIRSCDTGSGYLSMSGTSMASPMVAGAAALLLQARPDLTPAAVKQALLGTAARVPEEPSHAQGRGMIDPLPALEAARRG